MTEVIHTCIYTLYVTALIPEPTARSAVRRGLLIPHGYLHPGKSEHSEVLRSEKSINDCGRVAMVRRSRCMGGHLTDLMTVRSETGKDLKKKHVRKLKYCFTQYDGKHCFKFCSLKG